MRKTGDRRNVSGAYRFWGIATWGGQSWLQPPFEAAPGSTTKTDLVVAKPRLLPRTKRPPEKAAAARIGCPTSSSPKTDKHPEPRTRCVDCLALKVWPWSIMQSITSLRPDTGATRALKTSRFVVRCATSTKARTWRQSILKQALWSGCFIRVVTVA